jgi:MFS family permease
VSQPVNPARTWALVSWYAAFTGGTALFPWLAVLLMDRGWSGSAATLLLAALPVGRLVVIPVWAWVADRLGRPCLLLGMPAATAQSECSPPPAQHSSF